jgi:hypothetical protein
MARVMGMRTGSAAGPRNTRQNQRTFDAGRFLHVVEESPHRPAAGIAVRASGSLHVADDELPCLRRVVHLGRSRAALDTGGVD